MARPREYAATVDDTPDVALSVVAADDAPADAPTALVTINGRERRVQLGPWVTSDRRLAWIDRQRVTFSFQRDSDGGVRLHLLGVNYQVELVDAQTKRMRALKAAASGGAELKLKAPMPGVVLRVAVEVGATVAKGDLICVLEAMKMQNEIKADRDAVVRELHVKPGDSVQKNALLAILAPPPAAG
ncbi:MAG: acetyl-CoA carboxylase biotin carboxyl carrier protein subunit [Planctomycetota bacterium]